MATAGDQINLALRLIGVGAEGEPISPEMSADALNALNQWLDLDSINRQSVFSLQDQSFSWAANTSSRTLGATGNFVGTRPIALDPSTYFVDSNSVSYKPIRITTDAEEYNAIAAKSTASTYPDFMYVNMTMPNITMYLYPVPNAALTWHFMSVVPLSQPAALTTTLSVPPGYLMYLRYNLAIMLAAEVGVDPPKWVERLAASTRRSIKRLNRPDVSQSLPYGLIPVVNHDIIAGT